MRRARTTSGQSRLSSQSGGRPSPSRTWYAVSPPTSTRPPGRTRASVLSAAWRSAASTAALPSGDAAAGATRAGTVPVSSARAACAPAQSAPTRLGTSIGRTSPRPAARSSWRRGAGGAPPAPPRVPPPGGGARPPRRGARPARPGPSPPRDAPRERRTADLGDGGQHERLLHAERVHGGIDLGAEGATQPRVDLLEHQPRPAGADVGQRGRDPARRVRRPERAALRVAHADRAARRGAARLERRLHHDAAGPREELGADVAGAGQIVGENAQRIHVSVCGQARSTARAGAPSSSGNLSGRQTSV